MCEATLREMINNIIKPKTQAFGVVKLSNLNLNILKDDEALVRFAARYNAPICLSLFTGGADPSLRLETCSGELNFTQGVYSKVRGFPSSFIPWLILLVSESASRRCSKGFVDSVVSVRGKGREEICECCRVGDGRNLLTLLPCLHGVCEECFWSMILDMEVNDDVLCPVCSCLLCLDSEKGTTCASDVIKEVQV